MMNNHQLEVNKENLYENFLVVLLIFLIYEEIVMLQKCVNLAWSNLRCFSWIWKILKRFLFYSNHAYEKNRWFFFYNISNNDVGLTLSWLFAKISSRDKVLCKIHYVAFSHAAAIYGHYKRKCLWRFRPARSASSFNLSTTYINRLRQLYNKY